VIAEKGQQLTRQNPSEPTNEDTPQSLLVEHINHQLAYLHEAQEMAISSNNLTEVNNISNTILLYLNLYKEVCL
jgi:hypothetical protein